MYGFEKVTIENIPLGGHAASMSDAPEVPVRRASIRDVAKYAGVSHTMVSLILNGRHPGAPETRAKVLEAVEKLNYQPDANYRKAVAERGQPRARKKTKVLALIMPRSVQEAADHEDGYHSLTLAGVLNGAKALGYEVLISPHDLQTKGLPACVMNDQVDGVLLDDTFPLEWVKLLTTRLPCVYVNRYFEQTNAIFVTVHWAQEMIASVNYAWDRGHRNFAFMGADTGDDHPLGAHRLFFEVMRAKGAGLIHPELSRRRPKSNTLVDEFFAEWLDCDPRPTVVLTDDGRGVKLMRLLKENGLSVPEDLSIIGRLGHPNAAKCDPPLTSYEYPIKEIGEWAVRMLVGAIESNRLSPSHLLIEGQLIERASVKTIAASE